MSQFNLDLSYNFKGVEARSQSIRDSISHAENYNMTFAEQLAGDVFNALYQHNPTLKVADNSQYSQAIRAALQSPQFQHLRMQTRDSVHWSSTAAALITSKLAEKLSWEKEEQPPQPPQEDCEEPNTEQQLEEESEEEKPGNEPGDPMGGESQESKEGEPQQSSDEFDENGEDSDDSDDSNSENGNESEDNDEEESGDGESESNEGSEESEQNSGSGKESEESESSQNQDSGEQSSDESEDEDGEEDSDNESESGDGNDSDNELPVEAPSRDIEQAINEAAKEMDQLMGGIRAGTQESLLGSKEEAALAELYTALGNNPQLSQLIQMIGRMQINQHFLNGVSYAQTETPVSIIMGNDIRNVLPQDLGLLLGNNEEFNIFAAKYNNKELLQKELRAETNAGKGPMIVCLDESGSMSTDKTRWAQSVTIAMYLQCVKECRQFALVKFATQAKMWPLAKNNVRMDVEFMQSILNNGYQGGGTNFQMAWNEATTFIRKNPTWKQADIVFVTDGMGGFNAEVFRRDKDDLKIRLISFFIDPENSLSRYRGTISTVDSFVELNDAFTHIQDLSERGEKAAFELIRQKDAKGYFEVKSGRLRQSERV